MVVTDYLDLSKPIELSEEEERQLDALENRPIVYDEDCPPLTEEQLKRFRRVNPRRIAV